MKNLTLLTMTSFLFACSSQTSNPLEKYPGLKAAPPSNQTVETQTIAKPDLFDVEVNGSNEVNTAQFIEGQTSQTLIKVVFKSTRIQNYSIEMTDFSNTERPLLTPTKDKDVYALQWMPPVGTIPSGEWGKSFTAQIRLTVLDADTKVLVGLFNSKKIDVVVHRNNTQPKIIGRTDLTKGVDEEQVSTFSVDVEDTAGKGSPRFAEIQITPYIFSNTEAYRADASHYVLLDDKKTNNPEKLANGNLRFYYLLDVDRLPLDRDRLGNQIPSAATVDICFQMRAVSAVGTLSDQMQVCTQARYATQPPTFNIDESALNQIKSGVENNVTFSISAAHPMAVVSLKNAVQQIAGLSGKKSLVCTNENADQKNKLTCQLTWTPTCTTMAKNQNLSLKAENQMGSKVKSSVFTKMISIIPNDTCAKGGQ